MVEFRKVVIDGVTYNALTDDELEDYTKEVELKKELDLQHEKITNGTLDTMSLDDFKTKYNKFYDL